MIEGKTEPVNFPQICVCQLTESAPKGNPLFTACFSVDKEYYFYPLLHANSPLFC